MAKLIVNPTSSARREISLARTLISIGRDPSNDVALDWGVTGIPETFFISARGKVVAHVTGAVSAGQLRAGIAAARKGRPLSALHGGGRRDTR